MLPPANLGFPSGERALLVGSLIVVRWSAVRGIVSP
jgi:hypothetical protein